MLCYISLNKKNYTKINILILLYLNVVFYNYNHSFYNISIYYQIVSYLNTKSNLNFILISLVLYNSNKKKKDNSLILFVLGFFFILVGFSSIEVNQSYTLLINNKGNINNNLLNGIMLIHPYVLYFFYVIFIYCCWHFFLKLFLYKIFNYKFYENQKKKNLIIFIVILLSILLGCLWAEQELSWGGWWSWDFVELLALNYLLFFLYKLHLKKKNKPINIFFSLSLLLFSIITVRFNIINSIHNFIDLESQNQYYYYIMCIIYIILLLFFGSTYAIATLRLSISNVFLLLIIILYYLYQYNTIINYLILTTYNTQTNTKYIYTLTLIYAILILVVKIVRKKTPHLLIIPVLSFIGLVYFNIIIIAVSISLLVLNIGKKNILINLTHLILLLFLLFTQQQLYIFYSELVGCSINFIKILKVDGIFTTIKFSTTSVVDYNHLNKNSQIILDFYKNNFNFLFGLNKVVFEKNILILNNIFLEIYSYNLQKLTQTNGFNIFVSLLLLLVLAFLLIFKKYSSIIL